MLTPGQGMYGGPQQMQMPQRQQPRQMPQFSLPQQAAPQMPQQQQFGPRMRRGMFAGNYGGPGLLSGLMNNPMMGRYFGG